jgi:hypothetical protein
MSVCVCVVEEGGRRSERHEVAIIIRRRLMMACAGVGVGLERKMVERFYGDYFWIFEGFGAIFDGFCV